MRLLLAALCLLALPARGQVPPSINAPAAARDGPTADPFALGQITVTARRPAETPLGATSVGQAAIRAFGRATLDDAVALLPGVSAGTTGGARNERLVFVRGFDRFQVPLSVDGIRVYLPADNRLDFGRFLTFDLAEVQVAKGYVSVIDGPGALGGAVNLVTRKPTKTFEAEAFGQASFGRRGERNAYDLFGLAGTRRDRWYAQLSGTRRERDFWTVSGDFRPTETENGGRRELSASADWRVNAKVGFTPREGDEYTLSYTRQEGTKNAPLAVRDPVGLQRNWRWPYWDADSVYFLSTTRLGPGADFKARLFHNCFDNLLRAFDDASQTTQTRPRAFDSFYADESTGGSLELGVTPLPGDTLRLALHYRRDEHNEYQTLFTPTTRFTEPRQRSIEDTWSAAIENTLELGDVTVKAGLAYDWRELSRAEDYTGNSAAIGAFVRYPLVNSDALNAQGALAWRPRSDVELHASVSQRARFATLFDRFSTRFGGAASNPAIRPERATSYEGGGSTRLGPLQLEAAAFLSDVDDLIVTIPFVFQGQPTTRADNAARARFYGAELSLTANVGPRLSVGGNYTRTVREVSDLPLPRQVPGAVSLAATGVPGHKGLVWADWRPLDTVTVSPSLDFASDRFTADTAGTRLFRTGDHTNAALRVAWRPRLGLELAANGRNLLDQNYELVDGFPEEGRSFTISASARY